VQRSSTQLVYRTQPWSDPTVYVAAARHELRTNNVYQSRIKRNQRRHSARRSRKHRLPFPNEHGDGTVTRSRTRCRDESPSTLPLRASAPPISSARIASLWLPSDASISGVS
jgi:hypothetical protein